ncbi:lipocalin family protein [Chiayiivirga flava]|uniref:Outer membrane lipoprotein Blc n=1 Tax=Chiayiivirga flava TaxID=659595 RepID=A0A7W8D4G7_9GAMM|nr:lipocalin family protein [Chiayiivirga flava]MBB5207763.1 apolipoprotein D and lipocalin family protein [Chiayiivirga flava]
MSRRSLALAAFALAAVAALAACASRPDSRLPPLTPSIEVDLPRFMGQWYVIANIPYFGERGNVAARDIYTLNDDGEVDTVYRYRKGFDRPEKTTESTGLVQPGTGNAFWRIRFFGVLKADYLVLAVADDYSWALIGQPDRDLAWVFARTPVIDDALYESLLERLRGFGYDTGRLQRVPQVPEQLGKPGFQTP